MPEKIYGYAQTDEDVVTLQAYAGVDIIIEDMEERGQYRILRRFLREGDTLMVVRLSALYQQQSEEREVERSIRQQDGIQTPKKAGRRFGRPAIGYPRSWKHILGQWQVREISTSNAISCAT